MIAEARNTELYAEWLSHIQDEDTKDAYLYLVGQAASLTGYTCHPQFKGVIRDFRFITEKNEQFFSFITNQNWLLFYFRPPAVRSGKFSFNELREAFDTADENSTGEWTVKLRSIPDVKRIWRILNLT